MTLHAVVRNLREYALWRVFGCLEEGWEGDGSRYGAFSMWGWVCGAWERIPMLQVLWSVSWIHITSNWHSQPVCLLLGQGVQVAQCPLCVCPVPIAMPHAVSRAQEFRKVRQMEKWWGRDQQLPRIGSRHFVAMTIPM